MDQLCIWLFSTLDWGSHDSDLFVFHEHGLSLFLEFEFLIRSNQVIHFLTLIVEETFQFLDFSWNFGVVIQSYRWAFSCGLGVLICDLLFARFVGDLTWVWTDIARYGWHFLLLLDFIKLFLDVLIFLQEFVDNFGWSVQLLKGFPSQIMNVDCKLDIQVFFYLLSCRVGSNRFFITCSNILFVCVELRWGKREPKGLPRGGETLSVTLFFLNHFQVSFVPDAFS